MEVSATLGAMDDETRRELGEAGEAYKQAPEVLKAAIRKSALKGDKPADIHRAIGYAYTYDYVANLVRQYKSEASTAGS
jgi:hypothetical protein